MPVLLHRFDNLEQRGDIAQARTEFAPFAGNLETDDGLISLVELSLFTDRRAPPGGSARLVGRSVLGREF